MRGHFIFLFWNLSFLSALTRILPGFHFLFSQRDGELLLSFFVFRLFLLQQFEVVECSLLVLFCHENVLVLFMQKHRACVIKSAVLEPITGLVKAPQFYISQVANAALQQRCLPKSFTLIVGHLIHSRRGQFLIFSNWERLDNVIPLITLFILGIFIMRGGNLEFSLSISRYRIVICNIRGLFNI